MKNSKLIFSADGKYLIHWFLKVKDSWTRAEALLPEPDKTSFDVWDIEKKQLLFTFPGYPIGVAEDSQTFLMQNEEGKVVLRELATGKRLKPDPSLANVYLPHQRTILLYRDKKLFAQDVFVIYPPQVIEMPDIPHNLVIGPYLFLPMWFDFGEGAEGAYGYAINFLTNERAYIFSVNRHDPQVPINFSTVHDLLFVGYRFEPYNLKTNSYVNNALTQTIHRILKTINSSQKMVHGFTFHPNGQWMAVSVTDVQEKPWEKDEDSHQPYVLKTTSYNNERKTYYFSQIELSIWDLNTEQEILNLAKKANKD